MSSQQQKPIPTLRDRPRAKQISRAMPGALEVPLDRVIVDPAQPRKDWLSQDGEEHLTQLTESIREFGVLQPLVVRPDPTAPPDEPRYILIAGGRRREAASRAGLAVLPVVVKDVPETRVRIMQLLENIQRQDLAPLDEARAMRVIMEAEEISGEELGRRLYISGQTVRDRLAILRDQVVADAIQRGQITPSVGRLIGQLPPDQRSEFYGRLRAGEHIITAGVVEARRRRLESGDVHPDRRGPGRSSSSVQKTFENNASWTDVSSTQKPTESPAPAEPATSAQAPVQIKVQGEPSARPSGGQGPQYAGISVAQAERAHGLAETIGIALGRGLQDQQHRDTVAGLREVVQSEQAAAWSLALIHEILARVERTS